MTLIRDMMLTYQDPSWQDVIQPGDIKLLTHFDTDPPLNEVNQTYMVKNNTGNSLDTNTKKFGNGSLYCSTNLGWYTFETDERLNANKWTIEGWMNYQFVRSGTGRGESNLDLGIRTAQSGSGLSMRIDGTSVTVTIRPFFSSTGGQYTVRFNARNGAPFNQQFGHFALVRDEAELRCYINGVNAINSPYSIPANVRVDDASLLHRVGYTGTFSVAHLDEWRIVSNRALYTMDFVPPTEPYTV